MPTHRSSQWRIALPLLVAAATIVLFAPRPGLTDPLSPCTDIDGDGFALCDAACDPTGLVCGDCDDADAASHPGATETCNHTDDDCNGQVDETSAKVLGQQPLADNGASSGDRFGAAVAAMGDLDGDGVADLAVGAPTTDTGAGNDGGAVSLISGASRSVICTATDPGGRPGDRLGTSVALLGDVNADGVPDLAAGAPGTSAPNTQGRVVIISGADCSIVRSCTDSIILTLPGGAQSQAYSELGTVVAGIGDLNFDGVPDVLAGDPNALNGNTSVIASQNGRAAVFSGATCAVLRRHAASLTGENNVRFGSSVAAMSDMNGDGTPDYLVGSLLSPDVSNVLFGKVRLYSGATGGILRTFVDLSPEASRGGMGGAVAQVPDVNGDGVADIAAGEAQGDDAGNLDAGAVVLFSGADATLLRRCTLPDGAAGDQWGRAVAALPDLDGDGIAEVAASAPFTDTARGSDAGSIALVSGADCAPRARVSDSAGLSGSRLGDRSLIAVANLIGDQAPDFIAGSGYDATNAGTVTGHAVIFGLESDCDGDGYAPSGGDCDDADPTTYQDAPEICDGHDNNCDGATDENDPPGGEPCQTGQPGVCAAGQTSCADATFTCAPLATPSPESCDGLDNDCDGTVDEDPAEEGQACVTGFPGLCAAGALHCSAGGLQCVQTVFPIAETCNGLDDDCDGAADEENPGGGQTCSTGQGGACSGVTECSGGSLVCVPAGGTSPEICDGLDNDCDGATDEGDPGGGGACATGLPGVCSDGIRHCAGGALACVPDVAASAEVCDALDNDCDGAIDDGNPGGGVACVTGFPGVCGAGVTFCTGGLLDCIPDAAPSAETCNGLDDDCDGATDENNPGGGVACLTGQPGACADGTTHCGGGSLACQRNEEPSEEICDGVDNDCNGGVDDVGEDFDGDGISICIDNCPGAPNPGQQDADHDGIGDACDNCPTVLNPTQNPCACSLCGATNVVLDRVSGGNGVMHWQTDVEYHTVGFNILSIDNRGNQTKLNPVLIPCTECTSGRGAAYSVPIAKIKSGHSLWVEQIDSDGVIRRFGPAVKP